MMSVPLLEVKNLRKYFKTPRGLLHAVDDVSFTLEKGRTLGVVGESGCGKTTLGRTILHLIEPTSGELYFEGKDISKPSSKEMKSLRTKMQIIFQDPFSSLNPRMSVSETIMEPFILHTKMSHNQMYDEVLKLMDVVGLARRFAGSFPHELDGGRRQRIGIARALAMNPEFIVCDEPVSALDVSIQAQILNLLRELQEDRGLSYMFVTHDLSVVKYISDNIMVMYLGEMVEKAPSDELFAHPLHPYTKALLSAIPVPDVHYKRERIIMQGEITSPVDPDKGCRLASRCSSFCEKCKEKQHVREISPGHFVSCWQVKNK